MDRRAQPGDVIRDMAHQQLARRIASKCFVESHFEPEATVAGHEPGRHGERPPRRRQSRPAQPAAFPPGTHTVAQPSFGPGLAGDRAASTAFTARLVPLASAHYRGGEGKYVDLSGVVVSVKTTTNYHTRSERKATIV